SRGKAAPRREIAPRQAGVAVTGLGLSRTLPTARTTSDGWGRTPEKDSAARGASSLSYSIGVQRPSGQMLERSVSVTQATRRSAVALLEKPSTACLEAAYAPWPGTAEMPAREEMLRMCPPPPRLPGLSPRIASIAATLALSVPRLLTLR